MFGKKWLEVIAFAVVTVTDVAELLLFLWVFLLWRKEGQPLEDEVVVQEVNVGGVRVRRQEVGSEWPQPEEEEEEVMWLLDNDFPAHTDGSAWDFLFCH